MNQVQTLIEQRALLETNLDIFSIGELARAIRNRVPKHITVRITHKGVQIAGNKYSDKSCDARCIDNTFAQKAL